MTQERRLAPRKIADSLLAIVPDRDERASQLAMECLLTLSSNDYFSGPPAEHQLKSPKLRRFALRSLALGENFFDESERRTPSGRTSLHDFGKGLAAAHDFAGSENLPLLRESLAGLIDPSTRSGQKGTWLMFPFNESLLWYDARRSVGKTWDVRKVYMRGSGITIARILADPPFGAESKDRGRRTVDLIRQALTGQSQIKKLADGVEGAAGRDQTGAPKTEAEEQNAWEAAEKRKKDLEDFGRGLCRHADNVMSQTLIGDAAKLWSLRNIFALDLAAHTLRKAWERLGKPEGERCIVMSVGGPPRANNPVRCESEESYQRARVTIREAIILALADEMGSIAQGSENPDWEDQFEARSNLDEVCTALAGMGRDEDFQDLARQAFDCANYDRAGDGFRVLLESIGLLQGTGQWRYFGATPELLAAMVGALSEQMPMSSRDFFRAIHSEWGIVVSPETAQGTPLLDALDGADLARNARRLEAMLAESGLAVAMSDSTTVVGERSRRIH